jgi:hypothetical protein
MTLTTRSTRTKSEHVRVVRDFRVVRVLGFVAVSIAIDTGN